MGILTLNFVFVFSPCDVISIDYVHIFWLRPLEVLQSCEEHAMDSAVRWMTDTL